MSYYMSLVVDDVPSDVFSRLDKAKLWVVISDAVDYRNWMAFEALFLITESKHTTNDVAKTYRMHLLPIFF